MYAGRDAATSLLYAELKQAGAVEEVFQFFGCSYWEKNKIGYFVTGNEKEFFDLLLQCEQKGIYCTSGIIEHYRCKVPSGELENINSNYQTDTLKRVQESYSEKFFQIISQLVNIPAQNYAEKLFQEWEAELDDCHDEDKLALFQTTLSMVISMKLLDHAAGKHYSSWVQKKRQRLEEKLTEEKRLEEKGLEEKELEEKELVEKRLVNDSTILKNEEKHIFAGLVYLDCEKKNIHYHVYSQHHHAWQERRKLLQKSFIVSPIFTKELYFNPINFTIIQEQKQHFYSLLKTIMDDSYVSLLTQIYDFPPIVSTEYYDDLSEQINSLATQRERDDFLLLGSQLRLNRR